MRWPARPLFSCAACWNNRRRLFPGARPKIPTSPLMDLHPTKIGSALSGPSGIAELMDDLGAALSGTAGRPMHMLGGGNPAHLPAMQGVWRARMRELLEDEPAFDRMLANYDGPAGNPAFRAAMAKCLQQHYGWEVTTENIAVTNGGQSAFFFLFAMLAGTMPDGTQRKVLLPLVPEYIGYADQGLVESPFLALRPVIELGEGHEFKYRIDLAARISRFPAPHSARSAG